MGILHSVTFPLITVIDLGRQDDFAIFNLIRNSKQIASGIFGLLQLIWALVSCLVGFFVCFCLLDLG